MGRRQSLGPMWRIWPWLTRTSRVALPPTSALYYARRLDLVHHNSQQPCEFARVAPRYSRRPPLLPGPQGQMSCFGLVSLYRCDSHFAKR